MTRKLIALVALVALPLMGAGVAFAQGQAGPLESTLAARKVVVTDGRETLVDAGSAKPGEVIEYTATYRNTGKAAITGLQATVPIPDQTEFIPGSARPSQAKASLDGLSFADIPLMRKVKRDGREIDEQVPYREYRSLRWFAGALESGKKVAFTARVRVIDDRTSSEPGIKGGSK